jgi:magnesium transporter
MLGGASPKVHDELVQILGVLTDGIQEFGWYSHDLEQIAETVDQLPGMRPGGQQYFDRHRQRITRMRENGKDIREEARDALSHYSELVADRQAQVINSLTIVATVFLPLSFLTGYFGMNFRILTADAQNYALAIHPAGPAAACRQHRFVPAAHPPAAAAVRNPPHRTAANLIPSHPAPGRPS